MEDKKMYQLFYIENEVKVSNAYSGCLINQDNYEEHQVAVFDSKVKALKELENHKTVINEYSGSTGKFLKIKEYYVGEWVPEDVAETLAIIPSEIIGYSPMEIEVYNQSNTSVPVEIFDNWEDANQCCNSLDDGYIKF